MSSISSREVNIGSDVQLRTVPYPYRAMLAICSDLDETPDWRVYWEIMRFLNTTEETTMGPGVGLEVGNSIYFDMPQEQFAYWNTDDAGREMVRTLIHSDHIDCLHSYGDLATTRNHAARALDELNNHNCKLQVWIDHGTAVTNFGPDIMEGHGDEPGHEAYHADLTVDFGVKYIWRGRITSITGQDVSAHLGGMFRWDHSLASTRTLLKEVAKRRLALSGNKKYAMHGPNQTLRRSQLRDQRPIYEFIRCNPHWGGLTSGEEGRYIGEVLTNNMLNRLIERGGTCVLYTHLGKIDNPNVPFDKPAVQAFRRLSEMSRGGNILVTTTHRLLGYRRAISEITFDNIWNNESLQIDLKTRIIEKYIDKLCISDLSGLTFYVPNPENTKMTIDGQEIINLKRNPPDHTGQSSISIDWPVLELPTI